jgi:haloalkane dehalogenase
MPEVIRTADEKFKDLALFPFEPNWFDWNGIRMHYVDEGPKDAPVISCKKATGSRLSRFF